MGMIQTQAGYVRMGFAGLKCQEKQRDHRDHLLLLACGQFYIARESIELSLAHSEKNRLFQAGNVLLPVLTPRHSVAGYCGTAAPGSESRAMCL